MLIVLRPICTNSSVARVLGRDVIESAIGQKVNARTVHAAFSHRDSSPFPYPKKQNIASAHFAAHRAIEPDPEVASTLYTKPRNTPLTI